MSQLGNLLASLALGEDLRKGPPAQLESKVDRMLASRSLNFGFVMRKFDLMDLGRSRSSFERNLEWLMRMVLGRQARASQPEKEKEKSVKKPRSKGNKASSGKKKKAKPDKQRKQRTLSEVPVKSKRRKKARKEKKKKGIKSDDEGKPRKKGKKRGKLQRSRTAKELSLNMNFENFLKAVTRRPSHPRNTSKGKSRKAAPKDPRKAEPAPEAPPKKPVDLNAMIEKELSKLGKMGDFSHLPKEPVDGDENLLNNYETFECKDSKSMSKSTPVKFGDQDSKRQSAREERENGGSRYEAGSEADVSSNSFLTDPQPSRPQQNIDNPDLRQLIPILDSKTSYVFKEESNLFYSKFGPNSPENKLRDTIILTEGQNPSFKNIEIGPSVRSLLAEEDRAKQVLKNSFEMAADDRAVLDKIQMVESMTEETLLMQKAKPDPLNVNVTRNQIFTKKKRSKKRRPPKAKLKKVLSDVLKKGGKKQPKEAPTESERELDLSALKKLEELQGRAQLRDSLDNFDFIGQGDIDTLVIEPNANFENYIKGNFKKVNKYMATDFPQQPEYKAPEPVQAPVQAPRNKIKNMLLMGMEIDVEPEEHVQDRDFFRDLGHGKHPEKRQRVDQYPTEPVNQHYFNSDDSGKQPFIRESNVPNQSILLSQNPYQSQNFHEAGLFNKLMSNQRPPDPGTWGLENNPEAIKKRGADQMPLINDFEPKALYESGNSGKDTVDNTTRESDFIERFSQDVQPEPQPPSESPLERKTKFTDLIAKKDHFMKKYNIKIGSRTRGNQATKRANTSKPEDKKNAQKGSKQKQPPILQNTKIYSGSMNEIQRTRSGGTSHSGGARTESHGRFADIEGGRATHDELFGHNSKGRSKEAERANLESNQTINTITSINQSPKQSLDMSMREWQQRPQAVETPGRPNVRQASQVHRASPEQTGAKGEWSDGKWSMKNSIKDIRQKYSKKQLN